jgi:hypothetical protein
MKLKVGLLAMTLGLMVASVVATPANAQANNGQVNPKARQKATWYVAPHEIQIIDDRPVIKDFREAPAAPQNIQLPPGPQAGAGFSGGGGGAMGDDGGTMPNNQAAGPSGGQPAYRTDSPGGPLGLPKADFGHQASNIPARGMGPKGPLPGGFTTGVHAKMGAPIAPSGPPAMAANRVAGHSPGAMPAPKPIASYGGGYGPSVGGGSGGGMSTSSDVRGKLLRGVK